MAVGALIGAYQEDDSGGLRAVLPLAGRTVLEYQVRCAAAAGAAPIVVIVERGPPALNEALERLRSDGVAVTAIGADEAAARFEASALILLIGDGVVMPVDLLSRLADEPGPAVATVPDDDVHGMFERLDAASRWAGVALIDGRTLGSTIAMLGDWDLQSTLLRAALQSGAVHVPVSSEAEPLIAERPAQLAAFERGLVASSRGERQDAASRFVLPLVEDFATERLMDTAVRPEWLLWGAVTLTIGATAAFLSGWHWLGLAMLVLTTPLDLIAARLAKLRLRPLAPGGIAVRLLWPLSGLALLALAWRLWGEGQGWGPLASAAAALAFAEAGRIERGRHAGIPPTWLFTRRNALFAAVPLALTGSWTLVTVALALYACTSFFFVQYVRHAAD